MMWESLKFDLSVKERSKLGLSLAGGGFRASLFHLGVLLRMAEMDLLRYVEVLSTVSGGSIIGALYVLLLKKEMEKSANLSRHQYIAIIEELSRILIKGIQKNLRTRLFMNPLGMLKVLITSFSLGNRMSRLYERYLFQDIVKDIFPQSIWKRFFLPGKIKLQDLIIKPGKEPVSGGIEGFNRRAVEEGNSVITKIILNATTLNSGRPFYFTSIEIGDPRLGFIRKSEINDLLERKYLLEEVDQKTLQAALLNNPGNLVQIDNKIFNRNIVSMVNWWLSFKEDPGTKKITDGWDSLFKYKSFPGKLIDAPFGDLRQLKLPAWYVRNGGSSKFKQPVTGGLSESEHRARFLNVLDQIDNNLAEEMKQQGSQPVIDLLMDFIIELYLIRSAGVVSDKIKSDWLKLTLGDAVGASACFPPVFPPFIHLGIYDDLHVSRLALTDGGVYDNIGLSALLEEYCTHMIISDTSGLFEIKQRSSSGRLGMMGRILSVMMDDVAGLQRKLVKNYRKVTKMIEEEVKSPATTAGLSDIKWLKGLAFFHIKSDKIMGPGLELKINKELLASLRTDLDGFGDIEINALVNQGYDTADRYIRTYFDDSPFKNENWKPALKPPFEIKRSEEEIEKILTAGRSRFFRAMKLLVPLSILSSVVLIALILFASWKVHISVNDILQYIQGIANEWLESQIPFLSNWIDYKVPLGMVLIFSIIISLLYIMLPSLSGFMNKFFFKSYRKFITLFKWIKSLSMNIFWVTGLLPAWIALGSCIISVWSYLFHYLPFLRKTKNT